MRCSYCTSEIEKGTGLMYVKKNGDIRYFCSNRCFKFEVKYGKKVSAKEVRRLSKKQ